MNKTRTLAAKAAALAMALALSLTPLQTAVWAADTGGGQSNELVQTVAEPTEPDFDNGKGTEQSPFEIGSLQELIKLRDHVLKKDQYKTENGEAAKYADAHYRLTADIAFEDSALTDGKYWNGIGRSSSGIGTSVAFAGTFDGDGHKITGFTSSASGGRIYSLGLFGTNTGIIKNVIIENGSVIGPWTGALLCDTNYGTIENCYVSGKCTASFYAAGIAAMNSGGIIKGCFSSVSVSAAYAAPICPSSMDMTVKDNDGNTTTTREEQIENCCYTLQSGSKDTIYGAHDADNTKLTEDEVKNGKAAWLLSGGEKDSPWVQNLPGETVPTLNTKDSANHVYRVEFLVGENQAAEVFCNSGDTIEAPKIAPDSSGMVTTGEWYNGETLFDFAKDTVTKDLTLTSESKPSEHTVTLYLNKGRLKPEDAANWTDNKKAFTSADEDFKLPTPIPEDGFEFIGWTSKDDDSITGTPVKDVTVNKGTTRDLEYHAQYQNNNHPTVEIIVDGVEHADWTELIDSPAFDIYLNKPVNVTIEKLTNYEGHNNSQVTGISYYLSSKPLDEAEKDGFTISPDSGNVIIYVKVLDSAGHTHYVSSSGLVFDIDTPDIVGVTEGGTYCVSADLTVTDANFDKLTLDGEEQAFLKKDGNNYSYSVGAGEHTVVVSDKAGNSRTVSFTVSKEHIRSITISEVIIQPSCETTGITEMHTVCYLGCGKNIKTERIVTEAKGHSWGDWETVDAPNCSDSGLQRHVCKVCKAVELNEISPNANHDWEETYTIVRQPTCEYEGQRYKKCKNCDAVTDSETIPPLQHDLLPAERYDDKAPTCTEDGSYLLTSRCKNCRKIVHTEIEAIPSNGHKWTEWKVVEEQSDCSDSGMLERHCEVCGEKETNDIKPTEHDWDSVYTLDKAPTCTEEGSESIHCKKCGAVKDAKAVEPVGHKFGEWYDVKSSSCTTNGYKERKCTVCGYDETQNLDLSEHEWNEKPTVDKEPTCTTDGEQSVHCKNCDAVKESQTIPAKGHTFGEWEDLKKADCVTEGAQKRTCTVCEAVEERNVDIDNANHTWGDVQIDKEATCTEEGSSSRHCTKCGAEKDVTVIPSKGHSFGEWEDLKKADCVTEGAQKRTCTVCEAVEERNVDIDNANHTWGDIQIDKEATCTEEGSSSRHCTKCGAEKDVTIIPSKGHTWKTSVDEGDCTTPKTTTVYCEVCKTVRETTTEAAPGHKFGDWTTTRPATCTEKGVQTRSCSVCNETETRDIPANGHSYGEWTTTKAATCTTDGTETRTCTVCGKTETRTISATGHSLAEYTAVSPTCTQTGLSYTYCTVCGETISTKTIPAKGHSLTAWQTLYPSTCQSMGAQSRHCTVCGYSETSGIAPTAHDWQTDFTIDKAADCTTDGSRSIHCKNCDASKDSEVIPALGHDYKSTVVAPTETAGGYTEYVCSRCGDSYKSDYTDPTAPEKPVEAEKVSMTKYTSVTDAVRINWNAVEGADGYRVYRYDEASDKWITVKTLGKGDVTTYRNSGLEAGRVYIYKVKAFVRNADGEPIWGKASEEFVTAADPERVTFTAPSSSRDAVRLNWLPVACSGYKVQQYNSGTGKYETVKLVSGNKTTVRISGLESGKTYRFRIQAFTRGGDQKAFSKWSDSIKIATRK